ncbi:STAS domain-containing protein [Dactylosporangium aurantiacum]|uniref:Anti-sigma factor antagonist n=1 Tax=Dactylosporangium aurantiacum TaxID=35754 RepID=A0A9Q9IT53_9ACTN|nr:STAS domain-containing protein [Dactylosporangium aurantiacum]MDG6103813.1 STAS domain-containing protein [Dactylosporangium aurantiacum]UWZ58984.1 STAS domain-containing protein [Dactylosporangium aurantiacum]
MDLSLTILPAERCTVVQVAGVLDLGTLPELRTCLEQVIDDGALRIVLDLAGVRLIDSSALGALVSASQQLRQRSGLLCLACVQPLVRRVLELTSVDRLIDVHDTVAAAQASMAADETR